MPVQKQWGRTEVKADQVQYDWTITNVQLLLEDNGESILSPIFHVEGINRTNWCLAFAPRGSTGSEPDCIALYLHLKSAGKFPIKVRSTLTILNLDKVIETSSMIYTYSKLEGYGFPEFVTRSELLGLSDTYYTITIRCSIDIPVKPYSSCSDNGTITFDKTEGNLAENFGLMFAEAKNSDVTIIVGGEKFPAHKLILAARSPVFFAMFEQKEMEENIKNEVNIENMEPTVVKAMLEFIYTDKVTDLEALAIGLLAAADKYDLVRLRALCEQCFCRTLNKENAAEILVLAHLYQAKKLKNHVMKFIAIHLFDISETEGYKNMEQTYPTLLPDLIRTFISQNKTRNN